MIDDPVDTIQRAVAIPGASRVIIRGGVYREEVVPPRDGMTFEAYEGEEVTISGADILSGWTPYTGGAAGGAGGNGGGKIYRCVPSYPARGTGGVDDQIFVDGMMMLKARHPNNLRRELLTGPFLTASNATVDKITERDVSSITRSGSTATATVTAHGYISGQTINIRGAAQSQYNGNFAVTVTGANTFTYTVLGTPATPATLADSSPRIECKEAFQFQEIVDPKLSEIGGNYTGALVHLLGSGDTQSYGMGNTAVVTAVGSGQFTSQRLAATSNTNYHPGPGVPYYLEGAPVLLDSPGEWARLGGGELLLWTPLGTAPGGHVVEMRTRDYGFNLAGRSNTTIRGLRFFACSIFTDLQSLNNLITGVEMVYPSHFGQVRSEYEDGVATLNRDGVPIRHAGLYLTGEGNRLENSSVAYAAGSGVSVGGLNNTVENNLIHDVAYRGADGAGITTGHPFLDFSSPRFVAGAKLARNTIYNGSRALIQMRGLYAGTVQQNFLWHGMLNTYDYGAIYALNHDRWGEGSRLNGAGGGFTRITQNRIHSTPPTADRAGVGIYLDNDSYDYIVDHNVAWGSTAGLLITARDYDPPNTVEARLEIDPNIQEGLNISGPITISVWIKPSFRTYATPANIVRRGPQNGNEVFFRLNQGSYELGARKSDGTSATLRYAQPAADRDAWVHYAGVYTGSQWELYRNGALVGTLPSTVGPMSLSGSTEDRIWMLGGVLTWDEEQFWDPIDEFRIYGGALNASQIHSLSQGTAPSVTTLRIHLSFDNYTSGRNVNDASGTRNSVSNTNIKYGRTSFKNVWIGELSRPGVANNKALICPPTKAWQGMHVINNTFPNGFGYGSDVTGRVASPDPKSAYLNNITLARTNTIWHAALAGAPSAPRVFRSHPTLLNEKNMTTWGNSGDPGRVTLSSLAFRDSANRDYRLLSNSVAKSAGRSHEVDVPDTSNGLVGGAFPTKRIRITQPGTETPDLGAYASGEWVAGASISETKLPQGWNRRDIGIDRFFSPAGHTATVRGSYYVTGGGDGWSKSTDRFHFASTNVAGDGSIMATLQHQEVSGVSGAKAAVMIRASESTTADFVALSVSPISGVDLEVRRGNPATPTATMLSPVANAQLAPGVTYTLLADAACDGGVVTEVVFRADGTYIAKGFSPPYSITWTAPSLNAGENSRTVVLSASALSHTGVTGPRSEITVQVVRGNTTPHVTLTSPAAGAKFVVGQPIPLRAAAGVVTGSVKDVLFHRNGTYIGLDTTAPYEQMWTPTAPGSYDLTADIRDNSTPEVRIRSVKIPITVVGESEVTGPLVLRLERAGSQFSGFYSRDNGASWITAGSVSLASMPSTALAGLAATTQSRSYLTTAIFSSVIINDVERPALEDGFTAWLRKRHPDYADVEPFAQNVDAATGLTAPLQYALGVPATGTPSVSDNPVPGVTSPDGQGRTFATLTFTKHDDPLPGVNLTVQESGAMDAWQAVDMTANLIAKTALGDGRSRVTIRGNRSLETNKTAFLRLQVIRSPIQP
jgi:hypothetical protein